MKHIVIDARMLRTSTGRYVDRLLQHLQLLDQTHRYSVLLAAADFDGWQPSNPNFTKVLCPYRSFGLGEQVGLKRQLERLQPDLVHFAMVQQPILYRGRKITTMHDLTALRFGNPARNPLVYWVMQQAYKLVNRRAAHTSTAVISPTEFVKTDVASYTHISPDKITVTIEGVDAFAVDAQPIQQLQGKQFIMGDGRARPHKNLRRQLEAFAQLHQKYPDLYLLFSGKKSPDLAPFEAYIAAQGLSDYVIFGGYLPDAQLKWAMNNCQLFLWASLSEGFGLPPLEAMLNGAPVVSSNATCMPEVLGDAAHYFDPTSVAGMVQAVDEVLSSTDLRTQLIQKGTQHAQQFSWERMARQTLALYNNVLAD